MRPLRRNGLLHICRSRHLCSVLRCKTRKINEGTEKKKHEKLSMTKIN